MSTILSYLDFIKSSATAVFNEAIPILFGHSELLDAVAVPVIFAVVSATISLLVVAPFALLLMPVAMGLSYFQK